MKPHKESLAYAEKMRKRAKEKKMAMTPTTPGLAELYRYQQDIQTYLPKISALGSGTITTTNPELDKANAEITRLKSLLAERDEIIEALIADMGDIDALREENAELKAGMAGAKKLLVEAEIVEPVDGWVKWEADDEETGSPVPLETKVAVRLRKGAEQPALTADRWKWGKLPGWPGQEIIAYKVVE